MEPNLSGSIYVRSSIKKGTHPGTIYAKFGSIWQAVSEEKIFLTLANQKKELI
jgi:hypothetical protein